MKNKVTPFLWFDKEAEQAAQFYCSIFKHSKVLDSNPMSATFELEGQRFIALNGGPHYTFNEAVSFFVTCKDQREVNYYWQKLTANGGEEGRCGWLKDKYGLSWQVIPDALPRLMSDPNRTKAARVVDAMLKMKKIIVKDLERAYEGTTEGRNR
jgi:predicted 3-demethylubiquinone-9 3-methyltransferase (glyoxalase superfamily)